jgi:hypothetical protein
MGRERGGGGERDCWKENEPYVLDVADCREGRFFWGGLLSFRGRSLYTCCILFGDRSHVTILGSEGICLGLRSSLLTTSP